MAYINGNEILFSATIYNAPPFQEVIARSKTVLTSTDLMNIRVIGNSAFRSFSKLESVTFPEGVLERIETAGFRACTGLKSIVIPESCYHLGESCFYCCSALASVTIKGRVTRFYPSAFGECPNLKDIYVPWAEGDVLNAPWGAINATIHYESEV